MHVFAHRFAHILWCLLGPLTPPVGYISLLMLSCHCVPGLARSGLLPDDVSFAICTSGQAGKVGNLNLFPKAMHVVASEVVRGTSYFLHRFREVLAPSFLVLLGHRNQKMHLCMHYKIVVALSFSYVILSVCVIISFVFFDLNCFDDFDLCCALHLSWTTPLSFTVGM